MKIFSYLTKMEIHTIVIKKGTKIGFYRRFIDLLHELRKEYSRIM